jgi:RimJ/RimL family protein N-acetyltransferase
MTVELRTQRLLLRGWRESDKVPYAALNADSEVMRHFPSALSRDQSDDMVDRMQAGLEERGWGLWAAQRLDTSALIGFIGLAMPTWHVDRVTPCVEIGWRLARAQWGQGFAPEGAAAVLAHAFERLDPPNDEVVSFTTTGNVQSQRVMQKIGLRHDPARDFDHPMTPGWHGQRHVLYCIDRPTWKAGVAR